MGFEKINNGRIKLDLESYQSAREFLAVVREAARDAERIVKQFQPMQLLEDAAPQRYRTAVSSQKEHVDCMLTADKRLDCEDVISKRLLQDYVLIDTATVILYGYDGRRGIRFSLGNVYADVLWWRYLRYFRWSKVASMMGHNVTWCCRLADVALDTIDTVGFERAAEGIGGLHLHKLQKSFYVDEN